MNDTPRPRRRKTHLINDRARASATQMLLARNTEKAVTPSREVLTLASFVRLRGKHGFPAQEHDR
jgi:hypothetical protein